MQLALDTAPAELPITVADIKTHARIETSDDDGLLASYLDAAMAFVDGKGVLGRAIVTQTWEQSFRSPYGMVRAMMSVAQEITEVAYYDTDNVNQTDELSDYFLTGADDRKWIVPVDGKSWPSTYNRPDAIRVKYTAGYGAASAVPESVKQAIRLLVSHWYWRREAVIETKNNAGLIPLPYGFEALIGSEQMVWYG